MRLRSGSIIYHDESKQAKERKDRIQKRMQEMNKKKEKDMDHRVVVIAKERRTEEIAKKRREIANKEVNELKEIANESKERKEVKIPNPEQMQALLNKWKDLHRTSHLSHATEQKKCYFCMLEIEKETHVPVNHLLQQEYPVSDFDWKTRFHWLSHVGRFLYNDLMPFSVRSTLHLTRMIGTVNINTEEAKDFPLASSIQLRPRVVQEYEPYMSLVLPRSGCMRRDTGGYPDVSFTIHKSCLEAFQLIYEEVQKARKKDPLAYWLTFQQTEHVIQTLELHQSFLPFPCISSLFQLLWRIPDFGSASIVGEYACNPEHIQDGVDGCFVYACELQQARELVNTYKHILKDLKDCESHSSVIFSHDQCIQKVKEVLQRTVWSKPFCRWPIDQGSNRCCYY